MGRKSILSEVMLWSYILRRKNKYIFFNVYVFLTFLGVLQNKPQLYIYLHNSKAVSDRNIYIYFNVYVFLGVLQNKPQLYIYLHNSKAVSDRNHATGHSKWFVAHLMQKARVTTDGRCIHSFASEYISQSPPQWYPPLLQLLVPLEEELYCFFLHLLSLLTEH